jgi:hypothetical protein
MKTKATTVLCWGRGASLLVAATLLAGCAGVTTSKPHVKFGQFDFETQFNRSDIVVLNAVEGTSKEAGYVLGLVRVIDDTKWQVLGIKFFEDRFACPPGPCLPCFCVGPQQRAYYDALSKAPDADAVLDRGSSTKVRGFPFLFKITEVTYRGKAVKLKTD